MRNTGYVAVLLLLLLGSYHFFSGNYSGGTLVDRAGRDQVATVAQGDPDMVAAMRKARETLPEFLAIALAPRPTITSLAVKIAVPAGDNNEFFWISPFEPRDGQVRRTYQQHAPHGQNSEAWTSHRVFRGRDCRLALS